MLGCGYYLDKWHYWTAATKLRNIYKQLKMRNGLVKIPQFKDKNEEILFYLDRQNKTTGAFMDEKFPVFTYIGPTLNIIEHLENLAKENKSPIKLKYPLKFLDNINTPERLTAFLDDISKVGFIGAALPKTSYIEVAELSYYRTFEINGLYTFSPEWKTAFLEWLYNNQNPRTGCWGPRMRISGRFIGAGDMGPTYHIIKMFVDEHGDDINPDFPLKYRKELFSTTLSMLARPTPEHAGFGALHDWSLTRGQGLGLLSRYLWRDLSAGDKNKARELMSKLVIDRFKKYYLPKQGAFSLYPGVSEATLDGTGVALALLDQSGAWSRERREFLWGGASEPIRDLGNIKISRLSAYDIAGLNSASDINSIRIYKKDPFTEYDSGVAAVAYPKGTQVLDKADLGPRLYRWTAAVRQNMGNWTTKEEVERQLFLYNSQRPPVFEGKQTIDEINYLLRKERRLTLIGFDVLQTPRCRVRFELR